MAFSPLPTSEGSFEQQRHRFSITLEKNHPFCPNGELSVAAGSIHDTVEIVMRLNRLGGSTQKIIERPSTTTRFHTV
jgi:hypothetical protein